MSFATVAASKEVTRPPDKPPNLEGKSNAPERGPVFGVGRSVVPMRALFECAAGTTKFDPYKAVVGLLNNMKKRDPDVILIWKDNQGSSRNASSIPTNPAKFAAAFPSNPSDPSKCDTSKKFKIEFQIVVETKLSVPQFKRGPEGMFDYLVKNNLRLSFDKFIEEPKVSNIGIFFQMYNIMDTPTTETKLGMLMNAHLASAFEDKMEISEADARQNAPQLELIPRKVYHTIDDDNFAMQIYEVRCATRNADSVTLLLEQISEQMPEHFGTFFSWKSKKESPALFDKDVRAHQRFMTAHTPVALQGLTEELWTLPYKPNGDNLLKTLQACTNLSNQKLFFQFEPTRDTTKTGKYLALIRLGNEKAHRNANFDNALKILTDNLAELHEFINKHPDQRPQNYRFTEGPTMKKPNQRAARQQQRQENQTQQLNRTDGFYDDSIPVLPNASNPNNRNPRRRHKNYSAALTFTIPDSQGIPPDQIGLLHYNEDFPALGEQEADDQSQGTRVTNNTLTNSIGGDTVLTIETVNNMMYDFRQEMEETMQKEKEAMQKQHDKEMLDMKSVLGAFQIDMMTEFKTAFSNQTNSNATVTNNDTTNQRLDALEQQNRQLRKENDELRASILQSTSSPHSTKRNSTTVTPPAHTQDTTEHLDRRTRQKVAEPMESEPIDIADTTTVADTTMQTEHETGPNTNTEPAPTVMQRLVGYIPGNAKPAPRKPTRTKSYRSMIGSDSVPTRPRSSSRLRTPKDKENNQSSGDHTETVAPTKK